MNIDSRLLPREQWVEFLHELCHLLRHAGNQTIMPEQFTQAQEAEADAFTMYAAMPNFDDKGNDSSRTLLRCYSMLG
ncbi:ImmA/IrrE family metallo-endopeptidase [Paenibacillus alvei]|nr:ImmA/IrrE family metallo-endopeptidase [Paenibacillus alvei]MCY9577897.1 ImmA/IrrE family metallo-endopeptidase [Paenibacillus alvei]MCY9587336.1 ImmA/IrrE family metallo-endopeptidase [Paenibacillus alvei]